MRSSIRGRMGVDSPPRQHPLRCPMRVLLAIVILRVTIPVSAAAEPLPSRSLDLPEAIIQNLEPVSFDLIDYRRDQRHPATAQRDAPPHTIFVIKRHVGFAAGYDYGVVHAALGLYLTVAEWGRWNFGVPSPELGFGRYPAYDAKHNRSFTKDASTLFISLASVHYRAGYI